MAGGVPDAASTNTNSPDIAHADIKPAKYTVYYQHFWCILPFHISRNWNQLYKQAPTSNPSANLKTTMQVKGNT